MGYLKDYFVFAARYFVCWIWHCSGAGQQGCGDSFYSRLAFIFSAVSCFD